MHNKTSDFTIETNLSISQPKRQKSKQKKALHSANQNTIEVNLAMKLNPSK